MSERVLRVTELTSRLNALPFDDEPAREELCGQILGRALPPAVTIYPPFCTDHCLRLDLAERVFVNQGCTFLDYAGVRLGACVMVAPKVTFITVGHPVDTEHRRMAENVRIGAGATILPGVRSGGTPSSPPDRSWPTTCRRGAW